MYRTKFGIYVRVTGENIGAAKSVGVKTNRIKLLCLLISAVTCALAGLNLSVEELGIYTINMTANRGFICLSAINCGRKEPHRACVYAVIFGFARALQTILNNYVPVAISSLIGILPYVTIIVALLIVEIPNARKNHLRIFRGA
jgi:simple sugar transport system permease protein